MIPVAVTVAFFLCWAPLHSQGLTVLHVHNRTPRLLTAHHHYCYCCYHRYHHHHYHTATITSIIFTFPFPPRLCPSTAGCSPPSMPPIVHCCFHVPGGALLPCYVVCLVVPVISSLSLLAHLCSVWSTYWPSFLLYVQPISTNIITNAMTPADFSGGDGGLHHLLGAVPHPEADGAVRAQLDPRAADCPEPHLLHLRYTTATTDPPDPLLFPLLQQDQDDNTKLKKNKHK